MFNQIGVIGLGVVGNAVYQSLLKRELNVVGYDKYKNGGIGTFESMSTTDLIFLCLPTPYSDERCEYDKTSIYEVCRQLAAINYEGIVVLKSTVEPETTDTLARVYNLCMLHNPEFLTAKTSCEDFDKQSHIVLGRTSQLSNVCVEKCVEFYKSLFPDAVISISNSNESELMKLAVNNFYSVKIQFFNELFILSKNINADYAKVREMMLKNNWINPMHTTVPGPDGKLSYGGMCFPKDTNALLQYMMRKNSPHEVLKATVAERNTMRDD